MFAHDGSRPPRPAGSWPPACDGSARSTSATTRSLGRRSRPPLRYAIGRRCAASPSTAAETSVDYTPTLLEPTATGDRVNAPSVRDDTDLGGLHARLDTVADELRALVDAVPGQRATDEPAATDVGDLDLDRCLAQLRRIEGALGAVKARVVALATATDAHTGSGMASPDHYLRDRLKISSREARRQRELARTLEQMDAAADAFAEGRLGPEQASAIGRAARNGHLGAPEDVQDQLLDTATTSTPEQLNEAIRRAEQAADDEALRRGENRAYHRRRASCTKQQDGTWQLHAHLDPIAGEQVAVAIRAFTTPDPTDTPPGRHRRPEQRAADGLAALAQAALAAGAPNGGGHRPQISVLVPFDAWHRDSSDDASGFRRTGFPTEAPEAPDAGPPLAELGSGTTISAEAAQRLMCDARITRIVMGARSQILDVGRATRSWTAAQRAAAAARDRGCRGPGCDRPIAWCDLHHIRWWSQDGPTNLHNALTLCHQHHRLVHEGGWTLRYDAATAAATFIDPGGRQHTTLPRGSPD